MEKEKKDTWSMTRSEWNKSKKKCYRINWHRERETPYSSFNPDWEMTEKAEKVAINDYIGTHKNIYHIIHNKVGKIEPVEYEDDRDWEFANSNWILQVKSNIKDVYKGDILWLEDAREAIIVGRRLGFREIDILVYIIKNYIPELFKIISKRKKVPKRYFKEYNNLEQNL